MSSRSNSTRSLVGICIIAFVATGLIHAIYMPRYLPAEFTRGLPYLVVGWASFGIVFYSLGRLRPIEDSSRMPNMRASDIGLALFLLSIVLSGLLDTAGIRLAEATALHLPAAIGVYVGLALIGWGFGRRTRVINAITDENG
jgi:hypothetical protein